MSVLMRLQPCQLSLHQNLKSKSFDPIGKQVLTLSDIRAPNFKIANYRTEFKFDLKKTSFIATR